MEVRSWAVAIDENYGEQGQEDFRQIIYLPTERKIRPLGIGA